MRKILLVVLSLGASAAFALGAEVERQPDASVHAGRLRLTGLAADDVFAALPVDASVSEDGGTVTKQTPNVKCTFVKGEDSGFCDIETGLKEE